MEKNLILKIENSVTYAIDKTALYYRLKGIQFFKANNIEVTPEQYMILHVLDYSKNLCQRDLSKIILKDRANTTRLLNILEEKGLIEREIDLKSKRLVKLVKLSPKGKNLLNETFDDIITMYRSSIEGVSEEELNIFRKTLEKIRNNLSKNTSIQI